MGHQNFTRRDAPFVYWTFIKKYAIMIANHNQTKMNIEKQKQDREKCSLYLSRIENYLGNNYTDDKLLKNLDWIRYYIEDLQLEIEINKTLAEQERDYEK